MSREQFITKAFKPESDERIEEADAIMTEYAADGYDLTLRQLYYQFVSRGMIENTQRSYKRLGDLISNARLAGRLDWAHLTDRTRTLRGFNTHRNPGSAITSAGWTYKEDRWENQPVRVEVWVEKDALAGVIGRAAGALRCDFFACKGYASSSAMYEAAKRHRRYIEGGQQVVVLYLGDHDPSGLDMDRDIADRLTLMSGHESDVRRIALTWEQVQEHNPPPNPTKVTDSRAPDYIEAYGAESWELDALEPAVLEALITEAVDDLKDDDLFTEAIEAEQESMRLMRQVGDRWGEVAAFLRGDDDDDDDDGAAREARCCPDCGGDPTQNTPDGDGDYYCPDDDCDTGFYNPGAA